MTLRSSTPKNRPAAQLQRLCWGHAAGAASRVVTLLLVLAAGAVVLLLAGHLRAREQVVAALEDQVQAAERHVQSLSRADAGMPAQAPLSEWQWRRYSEAIAQLNAPWPAIFDVMERMGTLEAVPIGIEPDIQAGRTRIVIEARTLPQAYAYLDRLSQDPGVRRVQLIRHELAVMQRPGPALASAGRVPNPAAAGLVRMTADVFWRFKSAFSESAS